MTEDGPINAGGELEGATSMNYWITRKKEIADHLRSQGEIDAAIRVESQTDSETKRDFTNELADKIVLHQLGIDVEPLVRSAVIESRLKILADDYDQKLVSLAPTQRELFDAASETVPMRAKTLAIKAKVEHDPEYGHIKGCLSGLRKLGLLRLAKGGYLRTPKPR